MDAYDEIGLRRLAKLARQWGLTVVAVPDRKGEDGCLSHYDAMLYRGDKLEALVEIKCRRKPYDRAGVMERGGTVHLDTQKLEALRRLATNTTRRVLLVVFLAGDGAAIWDIAQLPPVQSKMVTRPRERDSDVLEPRLQSLLPMRVALWYRGV